METGAETEAETEAEAEAEAEAETEAETAHFCSAVLCPPALPSPQRPRGEPFVELHGRGLEASLTAEAQRQASHQASCLQGT